MCVIKSQDLTLLKDHDLWKLVAVATSLLEKCPQEEVELKEAALAEVMNVLYNRKADRDEG